MSIICEIVRLLNKVTNFSVGKKNGTASPMIYSCKKNPSNNCYIFENRKCNEAFDRVGFFFFVCFFLNTFVLRPVSSISTFIWQVLKNKSRFTPNKQCMHYKNKAELTQTACRWSLHQNEMLTWTFRYYLHNYIYSTHIV